MDYRRQRDLDGEVAVVTGGGRGIGFEAARALGSCGAHVVLIDLDKGALDAAVVALSDAGLTDVSTRQLDVTDPSAMEAAATDLAVALGRIDILVNSAGIARLNSALDTPDEEWRLVMDVNVNGVYWASRAFGRHMVAKGKGSIVNLGSMSGLIVNRPQSAASYMVSKGAVHMLTKALAVEWAPMGVRVNALAPGYVATDMTLKMRDRPELFNVWMDMTPMARCGEPQEIASAILFLASPASSYVTGAILSIDGGYTAW
ncbi:3-oxoacyl-ACP reductase [Mesorhizobium tianshanense]|uniref:NAD(P)-dependent dehydrogenase (Short-subunit alcohol dehydrogenase family) n=1 Tax=Mesorhizobium tianshanense TaxID=39844 RepID=A0A562PCU2_9HYPH|nr:SDR family oxidoreductase [Mesorhizobium tianshanense]TWI42239.1 NAD(P)-dependent dehydrogenase (short-subunit alcohol dehydrogenase family) [Mesorhizobium tianshanense]GLS41087.1 3-oxoacyl-ACP reductase [Mesorhizobium tianshanense]